MKTAVVLGNGKSGKSAGELLLRQGFEVIIGEDGQPSMNEAKEKVLEAELLVTSPGVHSSHPLIQLAQNLGVKVVSELELGFSNCKSRRTVAITGTNGKTTTATLTGNILSSERKTFVVGNIGTPFCSKAEEIKRDDNVVIEVSSYQLEMSEGFNPHIGLLLNVTPDHLERHGTMEKYIEAKAKIFKNQNEEDFAVFCADDPICIEIADGVKSNRLFFSTDKPVRGAFVWKNSIYFENENIYKIGKKSDIRLPGKHNIQNVLASVCAGFLLGVAPSKIMEAIRGFNGLEHRLTSVCKVLGVEFINDSKSTNIDSTLSAIRSMTKPTILLVGGFDKGLTFDLLFAEKFSQIKQVIAFGASGDRIVQTAKQAKCENIVQASSLESAIFEAKALAQKGDAILLSPACSSFDEFSNFEERGKIFKKIAGEIKKNAETKSKAKTLNKKVN